MTSKLKYYFPMIRSREEILKEIQDNIKFTEKFYSWRESERQEFLDFCTGIRGVKILYDSFFKEIMNPETVPERLEDFLSVLLQRKVKIVDVLPGDSSRIADEQSLLIMDILVRFISTYILMVFAFPKTISSASALKRTLNSSPKCAVADFLNSS